jgi:hypothetical protein
LPACLSSHHGPPRYPVAIAAAFAEAERDRIRARVANTLFASGRVPGSTVKRSDHVAAFFKRRPESSSRTGVRCDRGDSKGNLPFKA